MASTHSLISNRTPLFSLPKPENLKNEHALIDTGILRISHRSSQDHNDSSSRQPLKGVDGIDRFIDTGAFRIIPKVKPVVNPRLLADAIASPIAQSQDIAQEEDCEVGEGEDEKNWGLEGTLLFDAGVMGFYDDVGSVSSSTTTTTPSSPSLSTSPYPLPNIDSRTQNPEELSGLGVAVTNRANFYLPPSSSASSSSSTCGEEFDVIDEEEARDLEWLDNEDYTSQTNNGEMNRDAEKQTWKNLARAVKRSLSPRKKNGYMGGGRTFAGLMDVHVARR